MKFKFKFNAMKLMKLMILIENEFKIKLQFSRAFVNKPPPLKPPHFVMKFKFKFNAMKLIEKLIEKDVDLFWGYLYPFCSTFFTFFTLFLIFNFTFYESDKKHVRPRRVFSPTLML